MREVNTDPSQWRTNPNGQRRPAGLAQSLIDRLQTGEVPGTIQDLIGPVEEEDINVVIDILRTLKGDARSFDDLSPQEKRAFARRYLERTGGLQNRRSSLPSGAFVLGALAIVGGFVWFQTRRQRPPRPAPPPDDEEDEGDQ